MLLLGPSSPADQIVLPRLRSPAWTKDSTSPAAECSRERPASLVKTEIQAGSNFPIRPHHHGWAHSVTSATSSIILPASLCLDGPCSAWVILFSPWILSQIKSPCSKCPSNSKSCQTSEPQAGLSMTGILLCSGFTDKYIQIGHRT